jgi:protein ImuB
MSRILCAWSPDWAIANWRRRNPSNASPPDAPLALLETVRQVRGLAAISPKAAALGLRPGQKATDAKALVPELVTAEAEPEADTAALTALADWCVRFSPAAAVDPPDGLFLDITGVAHLWGGEAELLADFRARTSANGLCFRLAIADTAGAAWRRS